MKKIIALCLLVLALSASVGWPAPRPAPSQKKIFEYESNFAVVYSHNSKAPLYKWKIVMCADISQQFSLDQERLSMFADYIVHERIPADKIQEDKLGHVLFQTVSEVGVTEKWRYNKAMRRLSRTFLTTGGKYFTIIYYNKRPGNQGKADYIE